MSSANQTLTLSDAKALVSKLRENPDSVEIHQQARAICSNHTWPLLCEAGYPAFIGEYAKSYREDEIRSNGLPAWCLTAWEAAIALQASNTSAGSFAIGPLNINSLTTLRTIIAEKLLKDILHAGPYGSQMFGDPGKNPNTASCISAASGLLFALCHSLKVHPDLRYIDQIREVGAIEACTLCWYWTADLATRITSSISLETLLEGVQPNKSSALRRVVSILGSGAQGARNVVKKCKQMIKDGLQAGQMTDGHRLVELCLIQWLSDESLKTELGRYLVEGRVHDEVMRTVDAELSPISSSKSKPASRSLSLTPLLSQAKPADEDGEDEGTKEINWELVDMAGAVLLNLSNVADFPVATLIEYIERLNILTIMSRVFLEPSLNDDAEAQGQSQVQAWVNMLDLLVHCTTCIAPSCHYVRTDAYVNALRHALETQQLWVETLFQLESRAKSQGSKSESMKRRLGMWYKLGKEIGMIYNPNANPMRIADATSSNKGSATSAVPISGISVASVSGQDQGRDLADHQSQATGTSTKLQPKATKTANIAVRENVDGCWWAACERELHGKIDEQTEKLLSRCTGCKKARYCSVECQQRDWKAGHKNECKAFKTRSLAQS